MGKRGNGEGSIRKLKSGYWEARLMIGYNEKGKKNIKTFTRKTRGEVTRALEEFKANMKLHKPETLCKKTVEEWLDIWYKEYVVINVKTSTRVSYEGIIVNHLKPHIGGIKLRNLSKADIEVMYRKMLKNGKTNGSGGLSIKTIKNISLVLHKALDEALKRELIFKNPASISNVPTMRSTNRLKKEVRVLSTEEQKQLMAACDNDVYGVGILTILHTGVRLGELLGIQWSDIDFEAKTININKQVERYKDYSRNPKAKTKLDLRYDTKTKTSTRKVAMSDKLIQCIAEYKMRQETEMWRLGSSYKKQDMVFARYDGNFMEQTTFRSKYRDMLSKAGLERYTIHELRHTFATRALEAGIPIKVVSEILGHASVQITMDTYSHVSPDLQSEAMNRIAEYYKDMAQSS